MGVLVVRLRLVLAALEGSRWHGRHTSSVSALGPPSLFRDVRCFRCEACATVKHMWYRDVQQRQWHDVFANYNLLVEDRDSKLDVVECDSTLSAPFVVVQNRYGYRDFESWSRLLPEELLRRQLKAVVFDQPMEIGFVRGSATEKLAWVDGFRRIGGENLEIVFTGMDTAKTDVGPDAVLRYSNFYLTHAIENQMGRDPSRQETTTAGPHRFVVLVKKPKQWRFWFLARLFDANVLASVDYTSPTRPTICHYFSAVQGNGVCNETSVSRAFPRRLVAKARQYVEYVRPRTFAGTAQQGHDFASRMLEPRGRVHLVLESQAASAEALLATAATSPGQSLRHPCGWEERLTEKTFNAIAYGHPFMVVGTNRALDLLRAHGFETFGECLNESYARMNDPKERMVAVVAEVARINGLDEERYRALYWSCLEPIARANRARLLGSVKRRQIRQRLWSWGMNEDPGYELHTRFHPVCDEAARDYGLNLTACRS